MQRNLLANYAANIYMMLLSVAAVPLYVGFLGVEAYGLMGIYASLTALASLLDMGFSTTMNRELAVYATRAEGAAEARDFVRTLELIYWGMAVLIGVLVWSLAPFLATRWIQTVSLPAATVQQALVLIGLVMVLQWPVSFYSGGLLGLHRQGLLSGVNMLWATLRAGGAVLILWRVSPSIQAFLGWQVFITLCTTLTIVILLWRSLPRPAVRARPAFRSEQLRRVWKFSAGVGLVSVVGLGLTQVDKVVLSRLVSLEDFGYYVLGGTISTALYLFITPTYNAVFPRISQAVARGDQAGLKHLYHLSTQVLAVILLPAVAAVALFARELVWVWQGDGVIVEHTFRIAMLLSIGTGLHGLAHIPWAVQLAHGWTRPGLVINLVEVLVLVPLSILLAMRFGAVGVASVWIVTNLVGLAANLAVLHRRTLQGELPAWLADAVLPGLAALVYLFAWRLVLPGIASRLLGLGVLGALLASAMLLAALAAPLTRAWLGQITTRLRTRPG